MKLKMEKWNDLQNPPHYSLNVICLIMTDCSVQCDKLIQSVTFLVKTLHHQ